VRVERIIYIGKESNRLEEIEAGVIHSPESLLLMLIDILLTSLSMFTSS
jgi:hypothetical protein